MKHPFQKSPLQVLHRAVHEVRNQEQTLEIRLPEGMPDIGRILCAWGQAVIRGKEWRSDTIACTGGIMAWVLYLPEDGTEARCVEGWLPFQMAWDLEGVEQEGQICLRPLLRFVDARSISARKLMVRAGIAVLGEAFVQNQLGVYHPGELEEDIQLLKILYPVRIWKEAGEKAFQLDEELELPQSCPVPEKILCYTVEPEVTEAKISGRRVAYRGNGNLHILYRSGEGQLHTWDFELPFSQLGDLDMDPGEDSQVQITMAVTSLELQLDDGGQLRLKCGLLAQHLVSGRELLELIEDAYSPIRTVVPETEPLELSVLLEDRRENITGEQELHEDADIVVDARFLPDFPRFHRQGDDVEIAIPGQFQMLYYGENGALHAASARWEGKRTIAAGEHAQVEGYYRPGRQTQVLSGSGSVTMRETGELRLQTVSGQTMEMVTGLNVENREETGVERPSLILRRSGGESLWEIAKAAGSTMDAIRQANGFQEEPAPERMLLIPVF